MPQALFGIQTFIFVEGLTGYRFPFLCADPQDTGCHFCRQPIPRGSGRGSALASAQGPLRPCGCMIPEVGGCFTRPVRRGHAPPSFPCPPALAVSR